MKAQDYLRQKVNYGDEWVTIGWLYETLGDATAGLWVSGYMCRNTMDNLTIPENSCHRSNAAWKKSA